MAASRNEDSKQGLIIALVCFVILTIGLGVTTWLGYSDQENLKKKAKEAEGEAKTAKEDRNWYKYEAVVLKAYAGAKMSKGDLEAVGPLYADGPKMNGDGKQEMAETLDALKQFGWDQAQSKPTTTVLEYVNSLTTQLKNTQAKLAQTEQALKQAQATYAGALEAKEAEVSTLKTDLEKAKTDNRTDQDKMAKELERRLAEFAKASEDLENTKRKADEDKQVQASELKRTETRLKNAKAENDKLKKELTPPDYTKYDVPKGKVVKVDARHDQLWVSLGSADGIRAHQNLTFSVFGSNRARKGSIEIYDVLGPHYSSAKITDIVDAGSNPIVSGDDLISPLWSPGQRVHVAVTGLIDMYGDGKDHGDEFLQILKQQGIAVDEYLDLKDGKVKGDGMTGATEYLIVGRSPDFDKDAVIKENDQRYEYKRNVGEKMSKMTAEAKELETVKLVPAREFAILAGLKMPKTYTEGLGVSVDRPVIGAPKRAPKEAAKEETASDKKDEEKKDDKEKDKDKDK
jgi:hypothetical protein